MRLLIVEDELKTATFLKKGLTENGFVVDTAHNGEDGLHLVLTGTYDLVILDVGLPERSGWSVVTEIRQHGKGLPVLFLTARDTVTDRIKGLELGADDYLVKPFSFAELLVRVRTILRRGPLRNEDTLQIADLTIDLNRHRAFRSGTRLDLAPKEFSLLSLLARRAGEVLTRTVIADQLWDMNFDSGTNVVDVAIRRLRTKVDDPFPQKLIHTIRGVGYVLEEH
ncbi:heavy metal response regulator transcription factor [Geomonas ferrireducens]|uniref:heavy metal response regulator transcription factor n=1 Tax=Geomonas ferrireducens TaxID=2570227 RepID=UPI0010A79E2E|nr:heavy metal response regulator transcription factor [Geomonas ferrireducens]